MRDTVRTFMRLDPIDMEHFEGWLEAMGNLYRSFAQCARAKADGTFTPDLIDYPTISDGADGLAFVEACLESNRQGNVWVSIQR